MTPQPQQPNPNELFLITRDELDRCCSQMSAAGYKVSANYVEAMVLSRPAPLTQTQSPNIAKAISELEYSLSADPLEEIDYHIRDVDSRITPPTWKLWVYGLLTLIVGIGLGMWVSP